VPPPLIEVLSSRFAGGIKNCLSSKVLPAVHLDGNDFAFQTGVQLSRDGPINCFCACSGVVAFRGRGALRKHRRHSFLFFGGLYIKSISACGPPQQGMTAVAGNRAAKGAEPFDTAFHDALSATLDEWTTPEDEEAFRDL